MMIIKINEVRMGHNGSDFWRRDDVVRGRKEWKWRKKRREKLST